MGAPFEALDDSNVQIPEFASPVGNGTSCLSPGRDSGLSGTGRGEVAMVHLKGIKVPIVNHDVFFCHAFYVHCIGTNKFVQQLIM